MRVYPPVNTFDVYLKVHRGVWKLVSTVKETAAYYSFAKFSAKLWWFPISGQPGWLTRLRSRKSSSHFVPYRCPPWTSWFPIVPRAASGLGGAGLATAGLGILEFIDAMLQEAEEQPGNRGVGHTTIGG
ncbi:hypothetical protein N7499_007076 [Penicillium canescens]|nr:hypothetical protein N7522_008265 [Penicillium canescens]KAJ6082202.1 hypothetical protein N7499_007076 [Penicillium canescens]KAJ6176002.1 hypothetical protein N7485_002916 [Penicillium canescens]